MITLIVRTTLNPTGNIEIIEKALNLLYPFEDFEISEPNSRGQIYISAQATGPNALQFLFTQVRRQRIVQALHNYVIDIMNLDRNEATFMINKQALTQKYLSLCTEPEESPLGPIFITIKADNIDRVINYLFPETENGKVLEVNYKPAE